MCASGAAARYLQLVAVVLGMCIIMPIELVEGLDYLEDESSHAYKPNVS
jgi:hypothetical protein